MAEHSQRHVEAAYALPWRDLIDLVSTLQYVRPGFTDVTDHDLLVDDEAGIAIVIQHVHEGCVEVVLCPGRADSDQHGEGHLQQWHDDQVEHIGVHVGELISENHIGADAA